MSKSSADTEQVPHDNRIRRLLWFAVRVLLSIPVCLALWWLVLPAYAWAIGHAAALLLRFPFGFDIDGVTVEASGILNTGTLLGFQLGERNPSLPIAQLVSNIATYAALVIATSGIAWKRRALIAAIGFAVLAAGHVVYLVLAFAFADTMARNPVVPTAIAQAFITLPFVLWIALAYWAQADWLRPRSDTATTAKEHPP
ncbi:MAG: hypothetical protein AMXMBFR82_48730 [Candidatus Hydrogenedentota bacterium]